MNSVEKKQQFIVISLAALETWIQVWFFLEQEEENP